MATVARRVKRIIASAGLVLAVAADGARAQAPAADLFTVTDVPVDVTADDAVDARARAIAAGEAEGLNRLVRRLTRAEDAGRLPTPSGGVDAYVESFAVEDERLSSTRYIADLAVSYRPDAVRDLLRASGVPFTERPTPPIVLLPVYRTPAGPVLWQGDNPWRAAWDATTGHGLVNFVLPLGDLQDQATIDAGRAVAGDPAGLQALAQRYGAEQAVVAVVEPVGPAAMPATLRLTLDHAGGDAPPAPLAAEIAGPDLATALTRAVERTEEHEAEAWKRLVIPPSGRAATVAAVVPLTRLAEWTRLRHTLDGRPEIDAVEVRSFSRREVLLRLAYVGPLERLREGLLEAGYALTPRGETWLLQPTTVRATPLTPPGSVAPY